MKQKFEIWEFVGEIDEKNYDDMIYGRTNQT